MFRFLPESCDGWRRAALFLFQAFPVVGFFVAQSFGGIWPRNTRWSMDDLRLLIILGDFACIAVLFCVGCAQIYAGRLRPGFLNLILAELTAVLFMPPLSFVRT